MVEIVEWALMGLLWSAAAVLALWIAGAICFDVGQGSTWGKALALIWLIGVAALFLIWQPLWQPFIVFAGFAITFIGGWWLSLKPRHDRDWDPSVSRLPRCVRQDDAITFENVRDFKYRSLSDFSPGYVTRTVHLANLNAVDIIFFNWGVRWMSHPVLVFDFGPDGRICMSIEVRYRKDQKYSTLRSLYRQQELIFLAAEERDVILRRTKYSPNQTAHLYRMIVPRDELHTAFLDYCDMINKLYQLPHWYHGLCANCTTSYYRLPNTRVRFDWRILLNGRLEHALYADGRLDRSLPFEDLRRLAYINDIANTAPEDGFGDHLRRELKRLRHER